MNQQTGSKLTLAFAVRKYSNNYNILWKKTLLIPYQIKLTICWGNNQRTITLVYWLSHEKGSTTVWEAVISK